jgi:hypothetical protein
MRQCFEMTQKEGYAVTKVHKKRIYGKMGVELYEFLISTLMDVSSQLHTLAALPQGKNLRLLGLQSYCSVVVKKTLFARSKVLTAVLVKIQVFDM